MRRAKSLLPENADQRFRLRPVPGNRDEARGVRCPVTGRGRTGQGRVAVEQLHHPRPDLRHDTQKNAEEGSLVNPVAMQGFYSLCEMADLSDLEVDLMIQERDISKISRTSSARFGPRRFPTACMKDTCRG